MSTFELKPTGFRHPDKTYELVVRVHDMAETNYYHIGYVSTEFAVEIASIERGSHFLFGNPHTDKSAALNECKFCGAKLPIVCKTIADVRETLKRFPNKKPTKEDPHPKPNPYRGQCDTGLKRYNDILSTIKQENKL